MILKYLAILPLLSALLCIALGILTISRNPRRPANLGFMLGMISLAIFEAGNTTILLSIDSLQWALAGMRISVIGLAFLPPTWLIFTVVFARSDYKAFLSKWLPAIGGLFILAIYFAYSSRSSDFFSIYETSLSAPGWNIASDEMPVFLLGPLAQYFYIYVIIGSVLSLVHLENTLRASKGIQRWRIKYIIFGAGAILFLFIYISSQALLFSRITLNMGAVGSVVILISVSMMALFIVRHRLLEVDIFVSRYVVYNSVTILVVGVYLFAVGLLVQGLKYFNIPFSYFLTTLVVFSSLLTLVILLFSSSIRRKVKLFINKNFYKHKYEFRDRWMETTEKVSSKMSVDEMCDTLRAMILETMGAKFVDFWLFESASESYRVIKRDSSRIRPDHPFISCIRQRMRPFLLDDIFIKSTEPSGSEGDVRAFLDSTNAVLCAPMAAGEELIGFILQGEDISGNDYLEDDFELLKAITTQAAVQIKNIWLARELMGAKEVEVFHRMSSFIMHDLKNLTNSLSLVSQNAKHCMDNPEFQKDAIKTIDSTVSRMKGVISRLSNAAGGFKFNKKEIDLSELIDQTLSKVDFCKTRKVIVTKRIEPVAPICVDPHAMEMVLINLLTNAYDSIKGDGNIDITVTSDKNIHLAIEDNGEGMTREFIETSLFQPFKTTKKGGFGIGLYQCKAVVEAHGGKLEVDSVHGEGTRVMITLDKAGELKQQ